MFTATRKTLIIARVGELCNCGTRSHFALHICIYIPMSVTLGAYQVTSYSRAARVSCGYMVCARVSRGYMVCASVAWLHGLRDGQRQLARLRQRRHTYHVSVPRSCENECCAIPRVAGSASFNAVAFLYSNY